MRRNLLSALMLTIAVSLFFVACKKDDLPVIENLQINDITDSSSILSAEVTDIGDSEIIQKGFVWDTIENPSIESKLGYSENGAGGGVFTYSLELLDFEAKYYIRAYATNEYGTAYSEEKSFTTLAEIWNGTPCVDCVTVTDVDGNTYRTVKIGTQCWLVENLMTTKYNDGNQIANISADADWSNATTGAYCYYNNEENNKESYGLLYNFNAVETNKLCPEGWHVATDDEWKELEGYVDTEYGVGNNIWDTEGWRGSDVGVKLKSDKGWLGGSEQNGTDNYGFCGLPGGAREGISGEFQRVEEWGLWWSSKNADETNVYRRYLGNHDDNIARFSSDPQSGYSVRCIKNE